MPTRQKLDAWGQAMKLADGARPAVASVSTWIGIFKPAAEVALCSLLVACDSFNGQECKPLKETLELASGLSPAQTSRATHSASTSLPTRPAIFKRIREKSGYMHYRFSSDVEKWQRYKALPSDFVPLEVQSQRPALASLIASHAYQSLEERLSDDRLTPTARLIAVILALASRDGMTAQVSFTDLCSWTGRTHNAVQHGRLQLERVGLIRRASKVSAGAGRSQVYALLWTGIDALAEKPTRKYPSKPTIFGSKNLPENTPVNTPVNLPVLGAKTYQKVQCTPNTYPIPRSEAFSMNTKRDEWEEWVKLISSTFPDLDPETIATTLVRSKALEALKIAEDKEPVSEQVISAWNRCGSESIKVRISDARASYRRLSSTDKKALSLSDYVSNYLEKVLTTLLRQTKAGANAT